MEWQRDAPDLVPHTELRISENVQAPFGRVQSSFVDVTRAFEGTDYERGHGPNRRPLLGPQRLCRYGPQVKVVSIRTPGIKCHTSMELRRERARF